MNLLNDRWICRNFIRMLVGVGVLICLLIAALFWALGQTMIVNASMTSEVRELRRDQLTDRAMIRACPVTWPWNLLGWPSVNVPAGFTADGLPIGVQLMGPAHSEGRLVSLAAELEGIGGWAAKQPTPWWRTQPR